MVGLSLAHRIGVLCLDPIQANEDLFGVGDFISELYGEDNTLTLPLACYSGMDFKQQGISEK